MKVSNIKWNPYKNIVGNLNSHHSKTLTTEELLKINIKSILVMLQNRRGAFVHGRSNKDQLLQMHEKGFELIDALKNYGEFFNVQLHTKTDFDYDSFVSSFSK